MGGNVRDHASDFAQDAGGAPILRVETPEQVREFAQAHARVIVDSKLKQPVHAIGRSSLQQVDVDARVEQQLAPGARSIAHEPKSGIGPSSEVGGPSLGLEPPQSSSNVKTQDQCPEGLSLCDRPASPRNRPRWPPSQGRIPGAPCPTQSPSAP